MPILPAFPAFPAASPLRRAALSAGLALLAAGCSGGSSDPVYSVAVEPKALAFSARHGGPLPATQTLAATFTGDGLVVGTPAGTVLPGWLGVSAGPASGNRASVDVAITTTAMTPGTSSATLRFVTGRADGTGLTWVDVPVTYTLSDDLTFTQRQLSLDVNDGTLHRAEVGIGLASGRGVAWTATADAGLVLASPSGAAGDTLVVSYDALGQPLPPGKTTLDVRVSAEVSGATLTKVLPVALDVGPHRIHAVQNGVALASISGGAGVARLTATVPLVDNAGVDTGTWSAASDRAWLHVDGIGGGALAIRADPAGLAEGLHLATVTVASTGPRVEGTERVRVGLYVSSAAPAQGVLATGIGSAPVPDPIRPWVWLAGAADRRVVTAYNVYSGAVEKQLTFPSDAYTIVLAGDGSALYAGHSTIARVDVETGTVTTFPGDGSSVVGVVRPGGHEFVLSGEGTFFDAATGAQAPRNYVFWQGWGWSFTASADQRYLYGAASAVSPVTIVRARVGYSGSTPAPTLVEPLSARLLDQVGGMGHLAVAPDGSAVSFVENTTAATVPFRVYGPGGTGLLAPLGTFTGSTASDPARAVDLAPDGRVLAVAGTTLDCWSALSGSITRSHALPAGVLPWEVRFSGDGARALVTGNESSSSTAHALWAYDAR